MSGSPLNATFIQKNHAALFSAAIKRFGRSWQRALRAAGLDPSFHNASRGIWTRDKAEEWVRKRFDEGQSILARDVPADLLQFVQRRLQTRWVDFVELLGIPYPGIKKRCNWTRDALLAEIRKWRRAGHRLNYRSVKNEYQALIHQARKYFGSWKLALNAAGI